MAYESSYTSTEEEKKSYDYSNTGHHRTSETEQTYLSAKSALKNGEISVAQYNAVVDSILYPGYASRAAGYDRIMNGNSSMLQEMGQAAKQSPLVKELLSDVDKIVDVDGIVDMLDSAGKPKSSLSGFSGLYGSGSGSASAQTYSDSYQSYLDMLHGEQERVWQREDTAHQREVADLKAAGLNPVLSATQGVSSGVSSSSDAQVVGAVSDLAAMAISGLTETAKSVGLMASATSQGFLANFGQWFKKNGKTVSTAVNTASGLLRLLKSF